MVQEGDDERKPATDGCTRPISADKPKFYEKAAHFVTETYIAGCTRLNLED